MGRDWHAWYADYDDPGSSLSQRLEVVRAELAQLLSGRCAPTRLVSMCAGDARDALPVLAEVGRDVDALLVELDESLAGRARRTADQLGLDRVVVRSTDAGTSDAYDGFVPADVLLACGVFGNVTDDDAHRTVSVLPSLLAPGGMVVWTRGRTAPLTAAHDAGDPGEHVRSLFSDAGFEEHDYVRPADVGFRVGVHRLVRQPEPYRSGVRMFTFV